MKLFFLKLFHIVSSLLFWVFAILGTPFWIFGVLFTYVLLMTGDFFYIADFIYATITAVVTYTLLFATFFYLRKFAKKMLQANIE